MLETSKGICLMTWLMDLQIFDSLLLLYSQQMVTSFIFPRPWLSLSSSLTISCLFLYTPLASFLHNNLSFRCQVFSIFAFALTLLLGLHFSRSSLANFFLGFHFQPYIKDLLLLGPYPFGVLLIHKHHQSFRSVKVNKVVPFLNLLTGRGI